MAVTNTTRLAGPFIGNGTATVFPFAFKVFLPSDLYVVRVDVSGNLSVLALGIDYSAALNTNQDVSPGGTITLVAGPLASGFSMILTSNIAELQQIILTNLGGFFPDVLNAGLDRLTILIQQLQLMVDRSIKVGFTDSTSLTTLPAAVLRAGMALTFDINGNPAVTPIPIPVAGPRGLPGPSTGPLNVGFASQLIAGISGDYTYALNQFLATASSSTPVHLIFDLMCNTSGLVISPNGHTLIEGLDSSSTGFRSISGSNNHGMTIGPYSLSRPYTTGAPAGNGSGGVAPPSRTATNIILRNFWADGNGTAVGTANYVNPGTAAPANFPVSGAPLHPLYTIILDSCQNVIVENVKITNPAVFCLTLSNFNDAVVRDCQFYSALTFTDGVHVNGPMERLHIDNCSGTTGDDFLGLCFAEGWGGNASDITVTNCKPNNSATLARLYVSGPGLGYLGTGGLVSTYKARGVVFTNCVGSSFNAPFNIGIESGDAGTVLNQIEDLTIIGCDMFCTNAPFGTATADGGGFLKTNTSIGNLSFIGCTMRSPQTTQPFFRCQTNVGSVSMRNIKIRRDAIGNAGAAFIGMAPGIGMDRLFVDDLAMIDQRPNGSFTGYANAAYAFSPTVLFEVIFGNVDLTHFTQLINSGTSWAGAQIIRGSGCLELGAQGGYFPDANVANGTFYYSSSTLQPTVKVGGLAKALSFPGAAIVQTEFKERGSGVLLAGVMPELGPSAWANAQNGWTFVSGGGVAAGTINSPNFAVLDIGIATGFSIQLTRSNPTSQPGFQLVLNYQDASNYDVVDYAPGALLYERVTAGGAAVILASPSTQPSAAVTAQGLISVTVANGTITVVTGNNSFAFAGTLTRTKIGLNSTTSFSGSNSLTINTFKVGGA